MIYIDERQRQSNDLEFTVKKEDKRFHSYFDLFDNPGLITMTAFGAIHWFLMGKINASLFVKRVDIRLTTPR